MIKAIFFDLHKVVTYGEFGDIYARFAQRVGVSQMLVSDFHRKNLGGLLDGSVSSEDMLTAFGLGAKMDTQAMLEIWREEICLLMRADENMLALLTRLKGRYTLLALTNLTEQRYAADVAMGLYEYFDFKVLSFKEGVRKPDPRIFTIALKAADCRPDEVVFIDDQEKNTAAAVKLGIPSVQFKDKGSLVDELRALGVEV